MDMVSFEILLHAVGIGETTKMGIGMVMANWKCVTSFITRASGRKGRCTDEANWCWVLKTIKYNMKEGSKITDGPGRVNSQTEIIRLIA